MFNFFNKKKREDPVADVYRDLSTNQKMSIMNLLVAIGGCDGIIENDGEELQFINSYVSILKVRSDNCMAYLEKYGPERVITDLQPLSKNQKEFLVYEVWSLINCDGRANETEIELAVNIFESIGISEEQMIETIKKRQALIKYFKGE